MKYIALIVDTENIMPLEELLYGEEEIISIITNGVSNHEIENDNILGLYFRKWYLRINLLDNVEEQALEKLKTTITDLCNNLSIKIETITTLEDKVDYLQVVADRNFIISNNIIIVNNQQDFDHLKTGTLFTNEEDKINKEINKYIKQNNMIPIFVLQSTAFGTGSHETTKQCIDLIHYLKSKNLKIENALDMGTGTGILAMVISKLFGIYTKIDALDISEESIQAVNRFTKINHIENVNAVLTQGDGSEITNKKYDVIVSNILLEPLLNLRNKFLDLLSINGYLILSGFLDRQQDTLIAEYEQIGFKLEKVINLNQWVAVLFKKQ